MAIIINDPYARGGGGVAGSQLGETLSTGLQQLAQQKMQKMQTRQQAAQLLPLVGNNSQLAHVLAQNPKLQQEYFKHKWAPLNPANQPNQEFNSVLNDLIGAQQPQQMGQPQPSGSNQPQTPQPNQQIQPGQERQAPEQIQRPGQEAPKNMVSRVVARIPANTTPAQALQYAKLIQKAAQSEADSLETKRDNEEKRKIAESKILSTEQKERQKAINLGNKPWRAEHEREMFQVSELRDKYDQLEELLNSGNVNLGYVANVLQPIETQNNETQLYDKLGQEIANLKLSLVKKPSIPLLKSIERTKPNLGAGFEANMELINSGKKTLDSRERQDAFKTYLIDQNNGFEPADLGSKVMRLESAYKKDPQSVAHILGGEPAKEMGPEKPIQEQAFPQQQQPPTPPQTQKPEEPKNQPELRNPTIQEMLNEGSLKTALSPETPLGYGVQTGIQGAARALEATAGQLGNLDTFLRGIGNWATGGAINTHAQDVKENGPLPSSSDIRERLSELTGGYTEPKGKAQEASSDFISDLSQFFLPANLVARASKLGKGAQIAAKILLPFSGKVSLKEAAAISAAGAGGTEAAKILGAGPVGQSIAKVGTMLAYGIKGTRKAIDELGQAASNSAANKLKGYPIPSRKINEAQEELFNTYLSSASPDSDILESMAKSFGKALPEHYKQGAKEFAQEIGSTKTGAETFAKEAGKAEHSLTLPAEKVFKLIKDANNWYRRSTKPTVANPHKILPKEIRPELNKYREVLQKSLDDIVEQGVSKSGIISKYTGHPEEIIDGLKDWEIFKNIYKGGNDLNDAQRYLRDHVSFAENFKSGWGKSLFSLAGGFPVLKAVREISLMYNMLKHSPEARKLYIDAARYAAEGKTSAFLHQATKLDKIALAYEERMKKRKKK